MGRQARCGRSAGEKQKGGFSVRTRVAFTVPVPPLHGGNDTRFAYSSPRFLNPSEIQSNHLPSRPTTDASCRLVHGPTRQTAPVVEQRRSRTYPFRKLIGRQALPSTDAAVEVSGPPVCNDGLRRRHGSRLGVGEARVRGSVFNSSRKRKPFYSRMYSKEQYSTKRSALPVLVSTRNQSTVHFAAFDDHVRAANQQGPAEEQLLTA
jgi:hypothetical protein